MDWLIDHYAATIDLASGAGKRTFSTKLLSLTAHLHDAVEREHYETKVAARIGMSLQAIRDKSGQIASDEQAIKKRQVRTTGDDNSSSAFQDDLLAVACIDAPSQELLAQGVIELLAGDERQQLARYILKNQGNAISDVPEDLQEIDTYVKIVLFRAETRYAKWSERDRYFETARLIRQLEHENKKQIRDELLEQLRTAEDAGNDATAHQLRERLNVLIKEIARGK